MPKLDLSGKVQGFRKDGSPERLALPSVQGEIVARWLGRIVGFANYAAQNNSV